MEMYPPKTAVQPSSQEPTASYPQQGVPLYPQAGVQTVVPPYQQPSSQQPTASYPQQGVPLYPQAGVQTAVPPYQQPFPGQPQGGSTPAEWSTGLGACCYDPSNCIITACCPCVTAGRIAEITDRGATSCLIGGCIYTAIWCIYSCNFRTKLRSVYALKEDPWGDCRVHCFCECCALCQEYRELKIRGVDPAIGWQLNVEKWNRGGSTMAPPVASEMYR